MRSKLGAGATGAAIDGPGGAMRMMMGLFGPLLRFDVGCLAIDVDWVTARRRSSFPSLSGHLSTCSITFGARAYSSHHLAPFSYDWS